MKNTKKSPLTRPGMIAQRLGFGQVPDTINQPFDYGAVARDIDESIAVGRERRRQNELDKRRRATYGFMQAQQAQGLMIPSDSGYAAIDSYAASVSRDLADRGSQLVTDLENGRISSAEFGRLYGTLQNQVGQVKPLLEGLQNAFATYATDNAQGVISNANSKENEAFFQAGIEGKGRLELDENGVVVFVGESADGPFSIPANQLAKMPRPIKKVDSFASLTKATATTLGTPTERFAIDPVTGKPTDKAIMASVPVDLRNTEFSTAVRSSFDAFLDANGMDGLKSLAVDHGGFTYDEMEEMANSGQYQPTMEDFTANEINNIPGIEELAKETFANKLEFEMEKLWIANTAAQTVDKQITHWKQREYDLQMAKIAAQDRANIARVNSARTGTERMVLNTTNALRKLPAPTANTLSQWLRSAPNDAPITIQQKDGKFYMRKRLKDGTYDKKGTPIGDDIISNPSVFAQFIATKMYGLPLYSVQNAFNYGPIKKVGQLKKIRQFFNI